MLQQHAALPAGAVLAVVSHGLVIRAWLGPDAPRILLHRQTGADIAHAEYRRTCYELPQVAERLAVLALYEGRRWLSVHEEIVHVTVELQRG